MVMTDNDSSLANAKFWEIHIPKDSEEHLKSAFDLGAKGWARRALCTQHPSALHCCYTPLMANVMKEHLKNEQIQPTPTSKASSFIRLPLLRQALEVSKC